MNSLSILDLKYKWRKGILVGILIAIVLTTICNPALAQPSPPPGGGFGQFNQGIPVFWPYHAILLSSGFVLLVAGFFVARFRKTGKWYKTHMIFEIAGGSFIIAGLFIGVYMVTLSGLPYFRNIHEILGVAIGILIIITIIVGYFIKRVTKSKTEIRTSHRWLGRISIALILINIVLGLLTLSMILRR